MNPDLVVHYKIYLCVAGYEPEIRRITIDKDISHNYFYLKQKILAIFPTLKDVAFTISWKDLEGDNIRICTDDELGIALKEMESSDFKKIYVNATPQGKEGPLHPDVICDSCNNPVQGFRYKCIVCLDYDLCPDCERSQNHADHPMIRIPLPLSAEMPFGRRFARDISRMSKHMERLFQQTERENISEKKAKGDSFGTNKNTNYDPRRHHKMKFCAQNEVHNFLHNLFFNHVQKLKNQETASKATSQQQEQHQTEPEPSSSNTEAYPIYEEQKKFVNILTNGLNSFLDPLGIDFVVEEDPVKDENSQKPSEQRSTSNSSVGTSAGAAAGVPSTSASATPVSQPEVTQMDSAPNPPDPTPVLSDNSVAPVAVVAPGPFFRVTSTVTSPRPLHSATMGVPVPTVTVGVPPPNPTVGVQLPSNYVVQTGLGVTSLTPTPLGVPPPMTKPATQVEHSVTAAPVSAPREEVPVLDNSWTIINDGMGESFLMQNPPKSEPAPTPAVNTEPVPAPVPTPAPQAPQRAAERMYPRLSTHPPNIMSVEDAMNHLEMMGFRREEWLIQLVENMKGDVDEVLKFLSPIRKPSANSTN